MTTRKTAIVLFCGILLAFAGASRAQTALTYIAQGRSYIAASNLTSASISFSNAVALSPTDPNANFFYAVTRLLVLPLQPAGSNFLTRWGVPQTGRSLYHWTARPPADANGNLIAPVGVDADEATALLRTNFLQAITGAEANFGAITDTNFTVTLTSQEVGSGVTVDYGDIQLMRAFADALQFFIYNTYSWNLDAQLTTIRSLYTNDHFSTGGLLAAYPNLFTYATTNDLINARTAFTNAVSRYVIASQIIRNRLPGLVRLFNFDSNNAGDVKRESQVRTALTDLVSSLQGPVVLTDNNQYEVYAAAQFTGTHPLRASAPQFVNSGFVVGSEADVTFGGTIIGFTKDNIDKSLSKRFTPIPNILAPNFFAQDFDFFVTGIEGHGYVVQVSPDTTNWFDDESFVSLGGMYHYTYTNGAGYGPNIPPQLFYRVVDRPVAVIPPPSNDDFANSTPITGVGISVPGYNINGSPEEGEPQADFFSSTAWWSWTAQSNGAVVAALIGNAGGNSSLAIYTGTDLSDLTFVDQLPATNNQAADGYVFAATAGVTYQIQVGYSDFDGFYPNNGGGFDLVITSLPMLNVLLPTNDMFTAPVTSSVPVSATASDSPVPIAQMQVTVNGVVAATTTNSSISCVCTNLTVGYNLIVITATDTLGVQVESTTTVISPPPNDNFADRITLTGLPVSARGANNGASTETGEPTNGIDGDSVWWTWTAPASGLVTVSATVDGFGDGDYVYTDLSVYTGNSVSSLATVGTTDNATTFNSGPAKVNFNAIANKVYQIAVDSDYDFGGPVTLSVVPDQSPILQLTSPANGASYGVGSNVFVSATAADNLVGISSVQFYFVVSNVYYYLGASTAAPYTFNWTPTTAGSYGVTALATDRAGLTSGFAPEALIVVTNGPVILPPANDNFANRTTITGSNITLPGSNVNATREPGEPEIAGNPGGASVWYQWTAPKTGTVTINTIGSDFDTLLGVYVGTSVTSLRFGLTDDDFGGQLTSEVSFTAQQGTTYDIVVDGYDGTTGNIVLNLSQP